MLPFPQLKKQYIANSVLTSPPWTNESKAHLDELTDRIVYLYARIAAGGDLELAKQQLRAQLREKIVVDRETVWAKMVDERRREDGNLKVVKQEEHVSVHDKNTWRARLGLTWVSGKFLTFVLACGVLATIVGVQPFEREEESNCLAMLVFCTILWATEVSGKMSRGYVSILRDRES